MNTRRSFTVGAASTLAPLPLHATGSSSPPPTEDPRLELVHTSDRIWNGVATTSSGRVFACFPSADGPGAGLVEIQADGSRRPYPDAAWNTPSEPPSPSGRFVCVNSTRIGPDGRLWIVDAGAPALGKAAVPGGARLIVVDLGTDAVARIVDLEAAIRPGSYVDDIRFNGRHVYATDAGRPGLIVVDPDRPTVRRVLDGHWSTTGRRDAKADGRTLLSPDGSPVRIHADQLEVSPDGRWLYYQPACGPMARLATDLLDDARLDEERLGTAVTMFHDTPTTGGTAIDALGRIYVSDVEDRSVVVLDPDGGSRTLVRDRRLAWADALWIDTNGWLWLPVAEQHHTPGLSGGTPSTVTYPVGLYRMFIDAKPPGNDHA